MTAVEPAAEVRRQHVRRSTLLGTNGRRVHRDDFFLQAYAHAAEGRRIGEALLRHEVGEAWVLAQPVDEGGHGIGGRGEEQVDAFGREQDGALEGEGFAAFDDPRPQGMQVVEGDELVGGDVEDRHRHDRRV